MYFNYAWPGRGEVCFLSKYYKRSFRILKTDDEERKLTVGERAALTLSLTIWTWSVQAPIPIQTDQLHLVDFQF
jgi:hypothetical protein